MQNQPLEFIVSLINVSTVKSKLISYSKSSYNYANIYSPYYLIIANSQ